MFFLKEWMNLRRSVRDYAFKSSEIMRDRGISTWSDPLHLVKGIAWYERLVYIAVVIAMTFTVFAFPAVFLLGSTFTDFVQVEADFIQLSAVIMLAVFVLDRLGRWVYSRATRECAHRPRLSWTRESLAVIVLFLLVAMFLLVTMKVTMEDAQSTLLVRLSKHYVVFLVLFSAMMPLLYVFTMLLRVETLYVQAPFRITKTLAQNGVAIHEEEISFEPAFKSAFRTPTPFPLELTVLTVLVSMTIGLLSLLLLTVTHRGS